MLTVIAYDYTGKSRVHTRDDRFQPTRCAVLRWATPASHALCHLQQRPSPLDDGHVDDLAI